MFWCLHSPHCPASNVFTVGVLVQETFVCIFMLGGLMLVHKLVICTIICIFSKRPNPEIRVICKLLFLQEMCYSRNYSSLHFCEWGVCGFKKKNGGHACPESVVFLHLFVVFMVVCKFLVLFLWLVC